MKPLPLPIDFYRITRSGHQELFPPATGRGRFDSPDGSFRVLYGALNKQAAFAETLQHFRPSLEVRAALAGLRFAEVTHPTTPLRTWAAERTLIQLRLPGSTHMLDLRRSESIESAATALAGSLRDLGQADFDLGQVLGANRTVTQLVAAWAYQAGFDGLLAPSRFASEWTVCAVFDRVRPRVVSRQSIEPADPDLVAVARAFNIRVSG